MASEETKDIMTSKAEKAPKKETLTLTSKDLQNIVGSAVEAALGRVGESMERAADKQAAAILEARKPYVDPAQEENQRFMREQTKRAFLREQEALKNFRDNICPHLQGCNALSDQPGQLSSIIPHKLDTGEVIGICTNCQKVFRYDDADYAQQMSRKSGNRPSGAGQRFFSDPVAVIKAGR
jgi:hypothetical protein